MKDIKIKKKDKSGGSFLSRIFAKKSDFNPKKTLYWVLEEVEEAQNHLFVKFYNFQEKEVYREKIYGIRTGFLDEDVLQRIKKIEQRVLARLC